ncbi:MAG: hypothetical protein XD75_0598 [Parcubacteria bacterium 33_209]|nr:MAG: hypothetical protein XD75_0598 [Parcubacteria bacterium 33_209]
MEHFRSIGSKYIILDQNKNPSTRDNFEGPKWLLSLEEKNIYLIDKNIIKK